MLTEREAAALEFLYRRYASVVARVAATLSRSAADAEDVTHDVFLALPQALCRYRPGNFEGWLKTVAARTALMRIRRRTRERDVHATLSVDADEMLQDANGDTLVDSDRVRRAVAQLPDSLRHVVMLRLFRGLPHAEVARVLGLSTNACEVRLCRAIKQLRVMVGEGRYEGR